MSDPDHLPILSAPPYDDYNQTTPVVSIADDGIAPPPTPLPAQTCARSHAFHLAIAQHDYDLTSTGGAHPATLQPILRLAIQRGEQIDMEDLLDEGFVPRTPLMELCRREYGADDTLVAPDGQTTLRLAATNKQREITMFLLSRRLGAFKRIKFRSRKAIKRIRVMAWKLYDVGKILFREIPKGLLWKIPKEIILEIWYNLSWKNIIRVGQFLFWSLPKSFLCHLPKFFLWDLPKFFITEFPWAKFGRWLLNVMLRVYVLLVTVVNKVKEAFERFFSLLHTIALAI
ncbi:uncharacterized protein BT62DRAFT_997014 [Guyanagaster necrorhizus]|uniref:Uncharacterized protein n=1 Tax=Guyanagaster necrorhizus TaxID=856835 RepID=A0A9P7VJB0_9AGAR|nr:uncharacterized protein BT62DRAFT_997014 [Guyanagaster necrorhizus MCA 3950]KAG7441729.1 hypothetical protein BT62DRAFT_997014 [Guyanagaster necrorhizus MCA 3950]